VDNLYTQNPPCEFPDGLQYIESLVRSTIEFFVLLVFDGSAGCKKSPNRNFTFFSVNICPVMIVLGDIVG